MIAPLTGLNGLYAGLPEKKSVIFFWKRAFFNRALCSIHRFNGILSWLETRFNASFKVPYFIGTFLIALRTFSLTCLTS
jgi:hypothetical protein